jgi:hypothetical protein
MKKIILTVALAMTITACSPQEKVSAVVNPIPQVSVTESVLKVREPLLTEVKKEETSPKIVKAVPAATPTPKATTAVAKPTTTPKVTTTSTKTSTVEKNIVNHLLKYKVSKSNATKFAALIVKHSKTYGVNPYTILAMIQVETGRTFNPNLVGTHGDTGLLQVLPATQRYMKVSGSLFNPSVNIEIGAKYLAYTQKRFGNDLGIVAYNQGEGNVKRGTYNTKYLTKVNKALSTINR